MRRVHLRQPPAPRRVLRGDEDQLVAVQRQDLELVGLHVRGDHAEVGHAGHFFGAAHTLENFRDCFYRPTVWTTDNYSAWQKKGGKNATERALDEFNRLQEAWEENPPTLDPDLHAELKAYVDLRRTELGD